MYTGAGSEMMSSSTDDSEDIQVSLAEELNNIRNVMLVTRENIDALNAKFAQLTEPPPMYVQEYEELTSKLHDLKLKEQELSERMLLQAAAGGETGDVADGGAVGVADGEEQQPQKLRDELMELQLEDDDAFVDGDAVVDADDGGGGGGDRAELKQQRQRKQLMLNGGGGGSGSGGSGRQHDATAAEHFAKYATAVDAKAGGNDEVSVWLDMNRLLSKLCFHCIGKIGINICAFMGPQCGLSVE